MFKFFWVLNCKNNLFVSFWISKFLNLFFLNLKWEFFFKCFYSCFKFGKLKKKKNYLKLFFDFLELIKPVFYVYIEKRNKKNIWVPIPLNLKKQYCISLVWFLFLTKLKNNQLNILNSLFIDLFNFIFKKYFFSKKHIIYFFGIKNQTKKHFRWF